MNQRTVRRATILVAAAFLVTLLGSTTVSAFDLAATAKHDADGTVEVTVEAKDAAGTSLGTFPITFSNGDDEYAVQDGSPLTLPDNTAIIRFTFTNDTPPAIDFWLDEFDYNGLVVEAQNWTETDGTDISFPGCGLATDAGRSVADCGNLNDYVEYAFLDLVSDVPGLEQWGVILLVLLMALTAGWMLYRRSQPTPAA